MNIPVKVRMKNALTDVVRVADDELQNLIHQGLVSYHDALVALKDAGVVLDKRVYPWLREVENAATGEFNSANARKPAEVKPDVLAEKPAAPVKTDNSEGAK